MELNDILNILFALVVVVLTRYLIPYLKAKLEESGQESLVQLIEELVQAAEQIFNGAKKGEEKKAYVVKSLEDRNIVVDSKVDAQIESAVYRLTTKKEADN